MEFPTELTESPGVIQWQLTKWEALLIANILSKEIAVHSGDIVGVLQITSIIRNQLINLGQDRANRLVLALQAAIVTTWPQVAVTGPAIEELRKAAGGADINVVE